MKRPLPTLLFALLLLWAGGREAAACSCAQGTLGVQHAYADFVFTGTVDRVDTTDSYLIAFITTDEVFKGDVSPQFEVWTHRSSAACGYNDPWARFEVGEAFLLFAVESAGTGGDAMTHLCARNSKVSEAQADLERLRSPGSVRTFVPAAVGNEWTFVYPPFETTAPITVGVKELMQEGDRTYFTLTGMLLASDSLFLDAFGSLWWRSDGVDRPLLDFTADESGYVVQLTEGSFDARMVGDVTAHVIAGPFEECVRFEFDSQSTDAAWSFTFAPGVGLILVTGANGQRFEMAGATIDGKAVSSARQPVPNNAGITGAIHPNPLEGAATISLDLETRGPFRVSVHDALGREVALLDDGVAGPGPVELVWHASDMPAGVYYIRVASGAAHRVLSAVRL